MVHVGCVTSLLVPFADCMHTADLALSQRLAEELKYEQEATATTEAEEPESLTTFKKRGTWEVRQTVLTSPFPSILTSCRLRVLRAVTK